MNSSCSHVTPPSALIATWHCAEGFSTILFGESETYYGEQKELTSGTLRTLPCSTIASSAFHRGKGGWLWGQFHDIYGAYFGEAYKLPEPRTVTKATPKPEVKTCSVLLKGTTVSYSFHLGFKREERQTWLSTDVCDPQKWGDKLLSWANTLATQQQYFQLLPKDLASTSGSNTWVTLGIYPRSPFAFFPLISVEIMCIWKTRKLHPIIFRD